MHLLVVVLVPLLFLLVLTCAGFIPVLETHVARLLRKTINLVPRYDTTQLLHLCVFMNLGSELGSTARLRAPFILEDCRIAKQMQEV